MNSTLEPSINSKKRENAEDIEIVQEFLNKSIEMDDNLIKAKDLLRQYLLSNG